MRFAESVSRGILASVLTVAALLFTGCHSGLPKPESAQYTQFVQAFYVGLAAMEVGNDVRAEDMLGRATQLAPGEPAGWADWGILALRQRNFDEAKRRLDEIWGRLSQVTGEVLAQPVSSAMARE